MIYALIAAAIIILIVVAIIGITYAATRKKPEVITTPPAPQKDDGEIGEDIVASILGNSVAGEKYVKQKTIRATYTVRKTSISGNRL